MAARPAQRHGANEAKARMFECHRDVAPHHGEVSLRAAKRQGIPRRTALDGFDGGFARARVAALEEQALELSTRCLVALRGDHAPRFAPPEIDADASVIEGRQCESG